MATSAQDIKLPFSTETLGRRAMSGFCAVPAAGIGETAFAETNVVASSAARKPVVTMAGLAG